MDRLISFMTENWQRKLVAILSAIVIWFFVNASITETKTIPNVPIRVVNLPYDKTIVGMLPNGILSKRVNLTLKGSKKIVNELEPGDVEILLDASVNDQDDWVPQITRKNLMSLNPSIDLSHNIDDVKHPEFVIKLSKLVTAKVPVTILAPKGEPPAGYVYLDMWPQRLKQTVSGPEEQVQALANKGIEIEFDLNSITKSELDKIKSSRQNFHDDEVSYFIPNNWKKIPIAFRDEASEDINDPDAQNLHIDFLRKEAIPVERDLAVRVFYPLVTSDILNPETYPLEITGQLKTKNDIPYLSLPFYVKDVSPLFMEIIRDHMQIVVVASPRTEKEGLSWSVEVVGPKELENAYISQLMAKHSTNKNDEPRHSKKRESHLRARFREYLQKMTLFYGPDARLKLDARIADHKIVIKPIKKV